MASCEYRERERQKPPKTVARVPGHRVTRVKYIQARERWKRDDLTAHIEGGGAVIAKGDHGRLNSKRTLPTINRKAALISNRELPN